MLLAVFAMMLGQVAAMPPPSPSSHDASLDQRSSLTQTVLEQDQPALPCHHHSSPQGALCCCTGDCPMLTLALPVTPSAAPPMAFRPLIYRHDAVSSPDGTSAVPLLRPPRSLV